MFEKSLESTRSLSTLSLLDEAGKSSLANKCRFQRQIKKQTYIVPLQYIKQISSLDGCATKPHSARPPQLALRERSLGIERNSILVQQSTALVAHPSVRSLAAQLKKLWSRSTPSMRRAGVLDRGSTNAIDVTARSDAKTTPRAQAA